MAIEDNLPVNEDKPGLANRVEASTSMGGTRGSHTLFLGDRSSTELCKTRKRSVRKEDLKRVSFSLFHMPQQTLDPKP